LAIAYASVSGFVRWIAMYAPSTCVQLARLGSAAFSSGVIDGAPMPSRWFRWIARQFAAW
jgi:hypothetical protein